MADRKALIVTSISKPNWILEKLAKGSLSHGYEFILIGDEPSPADFSLDGCRFYDLGRQHETRFEFARECPTRHYARKNIGYLIAISEGAAQILETDDDNIPGESFWRERVPMVTAPVVDEAGWVNVYRYFTEANIWPRGLPLECLRDKLTERATLSAKQQFCPVQQGLVNKNPDTDAVYRLTSVLPFSFSADAGPIVLRDGSWCPFNSQNTAWWPEAYPLLYLPSYCSFRMTDIWRSFVAQRILWTNGWAVAFHPPDAWQERNEHDLLRDFRDEVPGYLANGAICEALAAMDLQPGTENIPANLRACYATLVGMQLVGAEELGLLDAWLADLSELVPNES